jgi:uncharacterized Zn-finger protein
MAASNSLTPPETLTVDDVTVACDGPGGAAGHPRVYLSLEGKGEVECPYCDRRYVLKAGAKPHAH